MPLRLSFMWLCALLGSLPASAHDLTLSNEVRPPFVLVRAAYGESEPVPFAAVEIYAPAGGDGLHQKGITDRDGNFAFVVRQEGRWRIVVDDGMGHRAETSVDISNTAGLETPPVPGGGWPRWARALTGASLLAALASLWYAYRARRSHTSR